MAKPVNYTKAKDESCDGCEYFYRLNRIKNEGDNENPVYQGRCIRFPPISSDNWPDVKSYRWCGEFKKVKK